MNLWHIFRSRRSSEPAIPKVWIVLHGMPFYVPVTDPLVELCYGRAEAEQLRRTLT